MAANRVLITTILLLLCLLAPAITQGQGHDALARVDTQMPIEAELPESIPPRPPRTYHYSKPARHDKRADPEPSKNSFAAGLSAARTHLMEGVYFAIDNLTRTYRDLQAAREFHRAARKPSETPAAVRAQLMEEIYVAVNCTTRLYRHLQAVLGYDRPLPKHADMITYMGHLWQRVLLGFWLEKLALGFAFVIWDFVFNAGTGSCWLTVGYVVAFLLLGPLFVLVDAVILVLEGW